MIRTVHCPCGMMIVFDITPDSTDDILVGKCKCRCGIVYSFEDEADEPILIDASINRSAMG